MQRSNQQPKLPLKQASDISLQGQGGDTNAICLTEHYPDRLIRLSPLSLCDYLPEQVSQLLFTLVDENEVITPELYTLLSQLGFRRSANAFYKPNCHHCLQCISSRVIVDEFKPSRRYRRVLNRNSDVTTAIHSSKSDIQEYYSLYQRYITARHADGNMYPPSLHTFEQFLINSPTKTQFIELREPNGKLIAVAVTDELNDGLSSIYTFFDPDPLYTSRSLGVFSILKQIESAKALNLPYVYLGYWIPTVQKMSYKSEYTPIELLLNKQWIKFEDRPDKDMVLDLLQTQTIQVKF